MTNTPESYSDADFSHTADGARAIFSIMSILLATTFLVFFLFSLFFSLQSLSRLVQKHVQIWDNIVQEVGFLLSQQDLHPIPEHIAEHSQSRLRDFMREEEELASMIDAQLHDRAAFDFFLFLTGSRDEIETNSVDVQIRQTMSSLSTAPYALISRGFSGLTTSEVVALKSGQVLTPLHSRADAISKLTSVSMFWVLALFLLVSVAALVAVFLIWRCFLKPSIARAQNAIELAKIEIEHRARTQKNLVLREQELQSVLNMLPGLVAQIDKDCRYVWANRPYLDALGINDIDDIRGKTLKQVLGDQNWQSIEPNVAKALSGANVTFSVKTRSPKTIGSFQAMYVPQISNGEVVRFIALIVDIEERLRIESVLHESLERLRITLDSIADAVITTDLEGNVQSANRIAEDLCGFSIAEARGRPINSFVKFLEGSKDDRTKPPVHQALDIVERALESTTHKRQDVLLGPGTQTPIVLTGAKLRLANGKLFGYLIAFRDLTQENRLQSELQFSEKMRAIGVLAGGISHDFNNMLGVVSGAASLIASVPKVTEQPKVGMYLDTIQRTVERAAALTEKLTLFAGRKNRELEVFDLVPLIQEVVGILKQTVDRKVQFSFNFNAKQTLFRGNAADIQSAILNICLNAHQAIVNEGSVDISLEIVFLNEATHKNDHFKLKSGNYYRITVRDTGVGIPSEHLDKVYDPFFTTKQLDQGSGLGLSMVYRTIVDHQGAIELESRMNEGTAFTILLPVPDLPQTQPTRKEKQHIVVRKSKNQRRVLLVDDEEDMILVVEAMLKELGCQVSCAENGLAALKVFQGSPESFDCVLTDLNMPEMDGIELVEEASKINPHCQFILMTGFSEDNELAKAGKQLPASVVRKPFDLVDLDRALSDMILPH